MHLVSSLVYLSVLTLGAILVTASHANPYAQAQAAHGYYIANCGGPNPSYCQSSGGSSDYWYADLGGVAYHEPTGIHYLYKEGRWRFNFDAISQKAWDATETNTLKKCAQKFGSPCTYTLGVYDVCVAVAAAKGDDNTDYVASFVRHDKKCGIAKRDALNACKAKAGEVYDAKSCQMIDTMKL